MKFLLPLLCGLSLMTCLAAPPATVGEQLDRDNPAVITWLQSLDETMVGRKVKGLTLSDGTRELKGATLLGFRSLKTKRQHIYLFKTADGLRAYVWVNTGGKALAIPPEPGEYEHAYVLSGDIYTSSEVAPGDGLVILTGATPSWLEGLK